MENSESNKNWLKKIITSIKNFFKREAKNIEKVESISNTPKEDAREQKLEELENSLNKQFVKSQIESAIDQDIFLQKINEYVDDSTKNYGIIGQIDGSIEARDFSIEDRARSHATFIQENIYAALNGRFEGLNKSISAKEEQKSRILNKLNLSDAFHNEMLKYANNNNKEFSTSRKWMYLIFGFILLVADIPLSINIVGVLGLTKMKSSDEVASTNGELLGSSDIIVTSQPIFFEGLWHWIITNWESILFAFGIAFSTILIKILYDEYIYTKLGKWIRDLEEFSEKDRRKVSIERYIKLVINILILAGLITMLFSLGEVRNEAVTLKSALTNGEQLSNEDIRLKNIRFWSFVLVTLVIPTISGICLSIGFTITDNINAFKRSIKQLKENEDQLSEMVKEETELSVKKSQLEVFLDEWAKVNEKIEAISKRFINGYNHGFKRAYLFYHGFDFYNMIESFHGEVIDNQLKNKIK